jgi:hypothetical protein
MGLAFLMVLDFFNISQQTFLNSITAHPTTLSPSLSPKARSIHS